VEVVVDWQRAALRHATMAPLLKFVQYCSDLAGKIRKFDIRVGNQAYATSGFKTNRNKKGLTGN